MEAEELDALPVPEAIIAEVAEAMSEDMEDWAMALLVRRRVETKVEMYILGLG